jgi:hypothetical protein
MFCSLQIVTTIMQNKDSERPEDRQVLVDADGEGMRTDLCFSVQWKLLVRAEKSFQLIGPSCGGRSCLQYSPAYNS